MACTANQQWQNEDHPLFACLAKSKNSVWLRQIGQCQCFFEVTLKNVEHSHLFPLLNYKSCLSVPRLLFHTAALRDVLVTSDITCMFYVNGWMPHLILYCSGWSLVLPCVEKYDSWNSCRHVCYQDSENHCLILRTCTWFSRRSR